MIRLEKTEGVYGPTIQGEGTNIGMPVTFIRLYGCDFRCLWCDTPFSLGKDMGGEYESVTAEEIVRRVQVIGYQHVVISGGNPLAQGKNLDELFESLSHTGHYIQVETQGSIYPTRSMWDYTQFWSLSPKLLSAGEMESSNWKNVIPILDHINYLQQGNWDVEGQLKFVVADRQDYIFLMNKLCGIPAAIQYPIILQPEGQQHADHFDYDLYAGSLRSLWDWVRADSAFWKDYSVRILPQFHKILWKRERGR